MRICTTLLAILAFALHLLLGCCWHHAHGESEVAGHRHADHGCSHVHLPAWFWSSAEQHCEHHHDHDHADSEESGTTPHAPCADPQCVFLVSGQISVPVANDLASPLVSTDFLIAQHELLVDVVDFAPQERISPHLRRHLALSRFLN